MPVSSILELTIRPMSRQLNSTQLTKRNEGEGELEVVGPGKIAWQPLARGMQSDV
jgi:hypothetical protein